MTVTSDRDLSGDDLVSIAENDKASVAAKKMISAVEREDESSLSCSNSTQPTQDTRKTNKRDRIMKKALGRVKTLENEMLYKQREIDSLSQLCKIRTPPQHGKKAKAGSPLIHQGIPRAMNSSRPLGPPASLPTTMSIANGPHYQTHPPQEAYYSPNPPPYGRSDTNL